ncbi:apolipoprotein Bb, tandem duplicate 1 isoform X2 [Kryptolebias marmoratus]|uniref:apolipoprotein Bb, tandem duplicate 1 isoform X2 n=1 Tax=Kryptolebias marmoratus TaxID=37003 RepID=UPI0007F8B58D|nr:apolipoprotein Bb, tandem duplicate 1 isoform X2 [Kryptolebias marmoratus]
MGDSKLCLLLLLSISALALAQDEDQPTCLLAQRYKALHKYEYQYEAESLNAINGASQLKNGPRATCKVEVEVPQTCSFIVHTTGCKLSEVVDTDAEGNPVFSPTSSSDAFAAKMEKHPLKVVVEGEYNVKLYPEDGETTTILNFKRGIVSALAVPLLEEDKNKNMPTIHGKCRTYYSINAREDIATDVSLKRDLTGCDKFVPIRDHNSPLALITGMHSPLAQMVRSSQTCNYKFDNEKKHMTSGSCTENHILVPFSHKGQYGVTNVGKQDLTLVEVSTHNDRVFEHGDVVKELHMEAVEDKSAALDKDAALNLMRELVALPETEGERRAHLFHTLVSTVRRMRTETLRAALPEAVSMSLFLTYQVLTQCGTPECSSAFLHILRTFDSSSLEVDAAVFALGLMSNPSALLINDMLQMAKHNPSKTIMYALSNVVKRFYKAEGKLIPEIHSVAEFMASQLGDCTGEMGQTFMVLRVVGNMAPAVVPASPALRSAVINCVKQPAASQEVKQAAVQVYRLLPVLNEEREVFMQVLLESGNSVQVRIAAYLILMKDPQPSELTQLSKVLSSNEEHQVKSFIISHITNILSSTEPETQELRQKIQDALQGNQIDPTMDPINFSRNYKIGSLEGNMIFEENGSLPKEAMLEMTLKAFGFEIDMMEIGINSKGFEPRVEALFGENGFFPDTALKTMYFVSDNMPHAVSDILENIAPALKKNKMKRQTSQHLMKQIGENLNKLEKQLQSEEVPEAMIYLRLLGNELGYLDTHDIDVIVNWISMRFTETYTRFPGNIIQSLMTNPDTTVFAHYIFMDNEFFLPTVTGVPLRIALSGTFTSGFKGGLQLARDMSTFSFMPSGGIEFVTQIGSHIPEYVNSGLEMHTNIFHESGITAKILMERAQYKLTIPAPTKPTKLIKITNTLVAVSGSEVKTIPPLVMDKVDVNKCTNAFTGMKFCTALQYVNAFSHETAPYFPLNGDSKFAVELHPTGEVTEYTVTVAYELLKEGDDDKQKVDSLKFILRAEGATGAEPTEARLGMKYNRRTSTFSADIQIPDYDVEAGLRLGAADRNAKGKGTHSILLELINKDITELSLIGHANLKAMKEGMLQIQVQVPSVEAESTVTAKVKNNDELKLELQSEIKIKDTVSEQKIEMKYDVSKIEVEVKSDMNTKTKSLPNGEFIETYANEILDMQVGQTDMKVRHIFRKFVEAANNYMEKYGAEMLPYMQNLRLPDIPEISLPETLFLNTKAKAAYHFNKERFTVTIPLPFGGKSTSEFNFPPALTTPSLSLPQFGLEIVSIDIPLPELVFPKAFMLSIPLFGKAEFSTMMKSNLYDIEATLDAGKDVVEPPSFSAKFDLKGNSPIDILSVAVEGTGMVTMTDSFKAHLRSSLTHKFVEAKISIEEDGVITEKINLKSVSKVEATSPFGLNITLEHTGMAGINTEELSGYNNFEGLIQVGPIYGKTISAQSFSIFPFRPKAKIDSRIQFDSTILNAQNTIAATLGNGEFSFVSNTNALEDVFTHATQLSFKDSKLTMICDANVLALGMKIHNQAKASAGAGEVMIRMETNGDHFDNHVNSLLVASLDTNGLAVNCNANMKLLENEAKHKATLTMNKNGLSTSGTTTLNGSLFLENIFDAGIDATRATLSISNKAEMDDMKADNTNTLTMTLSSLDFKSGAEARVPEFITYTQNIILNLKPYTASANVDNRMDVLASSFSSEAQFQAELYKMDLTGNLKASYGNEEIKHTYQINYADLSAIAKCSTTGKLFGTHVNHNTELEIVGLAAKFTNDAQFNSQPVRINHNIRWSVVPFDFNLDAISNADGDIFMYGKHSGQLYGKHQLRVRPLAFASLQELRGSTKQELDNGFSLETIYDYKMDTVLSPQEQKTGLKMKYKMNEQAFTQGIDVYNTADKIGIELSGTILTNIINTASTENQEFTISGFLKYDKSTDSRVIHFPLIENLPVFLESIKGLVVYVAEALQDILNNEEVRARLEALPQKISDLAAEINLESKLNQLQQFFTDLTQNTVTIDDVEKFLDNLRIGFERVLDDLIFYRTTVTDMIYDAIFSSTFYKTISQKIDEVANAIDDIKPEVVFWIESINEMINQTDFEKLKGSSIQFLYDIDVQYKIKAKVQAIITHVKEKIYKFDMTDFVKELKEFISFSKDLPIWIMDIRHLILKDYAQRITDIIKQLVHELNVVEKINYVYAKMKELIVKLEVDKKAHAVLEKAVDLIKHLKMEETIHAIFQTDIPCKSMKIFQTAINSLKTTEVKDIIEHLNTYIEDLVQRLKSLNYNDFVDHTNQIIAEYTTFMNEVIKNFEIPEKLEAAREFVNAVLSSIQALMEPLREVKVAEMIHFAKDISEQVVCDSLKRFAEFIKKEIEEFDFRDPLRFGIEMLQFWSAVSVDITRDLFNSVLKEIENVLPDEKLIRGIRQINDAFWKEQRKLNISTPSFTIPFTNLTVPTVNILQNRFKRFEIPPRIDIPEFIILDRYTVKATTIFFKDINQKIIELIDFIVNFKINTFDVDVFFGNLTLNYLPTLPEITLPEFTLPNLTFPTLPKLPVEKLVKSLEVPEIKLPAIPNQIMVPCFGKLHGEIKFHSPIYTLKTSAEFQNSTQNKMTPLFTGFFHSQGIAPNFKILSYKLDTTTRIAIPKMKRIVFEETVKFEHVAVEAEHQASVTLYGRSAQAQAKTVIKVTTEPYTANLKNEAFIAMEGEMTATVDTTYTHSVRLPLVNVPDKVTVTQKLKAEQDGFTFRLTAGNSAEAKCDDTDIAVRCYTTNHESNLQLSLSPRIATLLCSGNTDFADIKMKHLITAESGTLSYFKFNVRNQAEAPVIKNSLLVASGHASIADMKIEMTANHETELHNAESGAISNVVNLKIRPVEFVFEFQNKANAKVNIFKDLNAKMDLQNDYLVNLSPDGQKMSRVFLARLNEYKMFYNFTLNNNRNEAGIFFEMEGQADLFFLKIPINIPEIDPPLIGVIIPAFNDFNLYEQSGLQNILTTTEQTLNVDAKILYQKGNADLIHIPSMGRLTTDLSFKSAIFNLNTNALLYAEDGLVIRLGANTASVFDYLVAKLEGTTSLTTKKGIKLASSISVKNQHIEGTHNSTVTMSTETFEAAVSAASFGKIALPILNLEASQNLIANTKSKPSALSTLKIKGDFNIPEINANGKAEADHSLKLEGNFEDISVESSIKSNMNGRVFENYLILGVLDNEANLYLNEHGFRSTSKVTADAKLHHGTTKVIGIDVNNNMAAEASMGRLLAELRHSCNNEANLFSFKTKGKHNIKAVIDLTPISSLTTDIEIDMAQQSDLGDLTYSERTVAEVSTSKQKVSCIVKFVSPVYTTSMAAETEGSAPVFKIRFKSSATSPIVTLDYDLDANSTTTFENDLVNMVNKLTLTHSDLTMDVNHAIVQALRQKRQADDSVPKHTLDVDITSPTFTNVNLRYVAHTDAISASVSTPAAGFLGLQLNPAQRSARLYGRYLTDPRTDVDILQVRSFTEADKTNLQIVYNMEAQKAMVSELKTRLPSIVDSLRAFADKHHIAGSVEFLTDSIVSHINDAYDVAANSPLQTSQISIFFRNTIVRYQKIVQTFLDAAIKVLRETRFRLPGSDELTTLPELLQRLTGSVAHTLEETIKPIHDRVEAYYNDLVKTLDSIKVQMPDGDVITGRQIALEVNNVVKELFVFVVDFLGNIDTTLEKIGELLKASVEEIQGVVDSVESDFLESMLLEINAMYLRALSAVRDQISSFAATDFSRACESILDAIIQFIDQFNNNVLGYLRQTSEEVQGRMLVSDGKLEITLPIDFQQ